MENGASMYRFPMFWLPEDALRKVMKKMDYLELILLSLVSQKSKQAVSNLKLVAHQITIPFISEDFIQVYFHVGLAKDILVTFMLLPENMGVFAFNLQFLEQENVVQNTKIMNGTMMLLKNWMAHLQSIFHHNQIDCLGLDQRAEVFDLQLVNKIFPRVEKWELRDLNSELLESVVKNLNPSKSAYLNGKSCFETPAFTHFFLSQQFQALNVNACLSDWLKFTADEFSQINARYVKLEGLKEVTEKDLNRFLKLWKNGAAPYLEFLEIKLMIGRTMDREKILKGLEYKEHSENEVREHENCYGLVSGLKFQGGCDILKKDGGRMTVFIRNIWLSPVVRLFVWPKDSRKIL